jgi:hypothetical protein
MSLFVVMLGLAGAGWLLCFLVRNATDGWKAEDWIIASFRAFLMLICGGVTLFFSAGTANLIGLLGAEPHQQLLMAFLPPVLAAGGAWFWTRGRL